MYYPAGAMRLLKEQRVRSKMLTAGRCSLRVTRASAGVASTRSQSMATGATQNEKVSDGR